MNSSLGLREEGKKNKTKKKNNNRPFMHRANAVFKRKKQFVQVFKNKQKQTKNRNNYS